MFLPRWKLAQRGFSRVWRSLHFVVLHVWCF